MSLTALPDVLIESLCNAALMGRAISGTGVHIERLDGRNPGQITRGVGCQGDEAQRVDAAPDIERIQGFTFSVPFFAQCIMCREGAAGVGVGEFDAHVFQRVFLRSLPMSLNSPPCRRRITLLPRHIAGVVLDTGAICAHRQQQQSPPRQEVDCHRRPCQGSPDRRPQLQLVLGNVPHTGYTLTLHTRYHSCAHLVRRRLDSPAVHLSIAVVVWHCHVLEPLQ